jgi:hypothetical protein
MAPEATPPTDELPRRLRSVPFTASEQIAELYRMAQAAQVKIARLEAVTGARKATLGPVVPLASLRQELMNAGALCGHCQVPIIHPLTTGVRITAAELVRAITSHICQ